MPKVSFVVPLYNKEAYISDCLKSVCDQSLKDIEIVVVDDCSTDDSVDIVNFWAEKDNRIVLYKLPKNKGRSYARNFGNEKAKSKIILVQDADDLAIFERAKITYKFFEKHPDYDVFYSAYYIGLNNGSPVELIEAQPFDLERVKRTGATFVGHSTMGYTKKAILDVPYEGGKWSSLGLDDWKLQMELWKKGYKFGFSKEPLMIYRQVATSISAVRNMTAVYKLKGEYMGDK